MARVHGVHEITLRPGVSGEEFERFFIEEVLPAPQPAGTRLHLWKGDRGERAGQYALIIELDSVEARDRYFPTPGNMSEEAQRVYGEQQALFEKWGSLGTLPEEEGTVYTDYVTIGE